MLNQTIIELLKNGAGVLAENGIQDSRFDAEILLAAATGLKRHILLTSPNLVPSPDSCKLYQSYIEQRQRHKPVQYILNHSEFMSLSFYVDENVLIPRGDTEVLVEKAIEIVNKKSYTNVLELGTGSGCISVAVGKYSPGSKITATDISQAALNIAEANAKANRVANIRFLQSNLFSAVEDIYDLIISNPPYIETDEIERLDSNVKNYEPYIALDGGFDGLGFYREICKAAPQFLRKGGAIALEIGNTQQRQVSKLLTENGFTCIELIKDLAGWPRVLTASL